MRSRLALLLLPLAVLFLVLRPRMPTSVPLHIHLGARGAEVRQVELKFERDESIARDLTLHFPEGAPADVERTVRLTPGEYRVAVRVVDKNGREARDAKPQHVSADDGIEVDVAFLR